jgi:hypothetical protein
MKWFSSQHAKCIPYWVQALLEKANRLMGEMERKGRAARKVIAKEIWY